MDTTITFPVPWLPMLIGLFVVSVVGGVRELCARSRAKHAAVTARRRETTDLLFPSPWNDVYDECSEISSNPDSRSFLRKWLMDAKHKGLELPLLSSEAVHAFVCELTYPSVEWDDPKFWREECLSLLAPYDNDQLLIALAGKEKVAVEEVRFAAEKAANLRKKQDLFRCPWDEAYDACRTTATWQGAQHWLRKWILEQDDLPSLTTKAVEELVEHLAEKDSFEEKAWFELLSPYLDTGNDTYRNISDCNLRDQLPTEWYDFWKELKGYPSRKMLFMQMIGKHEEDGFMVHAATEVSLTSDQAALLCRALGHGNRIDTAFYADDLAKFVRSTTKDVSLCRDDRVSDDGKDDDW